MYGSLSAQNIHPEKEESWSLLRQKVFGTRGECPPELEKPGLKIAEKCDGLPLLILTVAEQLLKVEISEDLWNNVASGKEKSIFKNAHHQISKVLLLSYQCLPEYLKSCFLFMGIFREKYEIPTFNLTQMLIAEEFLEHNSSQVVDDFAVECLFDLLDKSLVMEPKEDYGLERKRCRLHAVFWHLSNSEAMKSKFFHAINSYDDCSIENIWDQRRLCIRNSILLGFKGVQDSIASNTTAHSLMCVSQAQQYPVPFNFNMRLLRVLNALAIRRYKFPNEFMSRIQLRYLSLTCNEKLPSSVSNLRKLQCLIVKRYMNIKSSKDSWHLPVEIWDLKELKHLEVHWKITSLVPTPLCRISIKHCYKLRELPSPFHIQHVQKTEIVDCSNSTQTWARNMEYAMTSHCEVEVDNSWNAPTVKNQS